MVEKNSDGGPKVITDRRARGGSPLTGRVLTVLASSLALAVVAGAVLLWYFH